MRVVFGFANFLNVRRPHTPTDWWTSQADDNYAKLITTAINKITLFNSANILPT